LTSGGLQAGLLTKATEERCVGVMGVESEGNVQVFAAGDVVVEQQGRAGLGCGVRLLLSVALMLGRGSLAGLREESAIHDPHLP
jgi:hypothetical protein